MLTLGSSVCWGRAHAADPRASSPHRLTRTRGRVGWGAWALIPPEAPLLLLILATQTETK